MLDTSGSHRFARMALLVAIVVLNACSNPPGRGPEATAERSPDAGSADRRVALALEDVTGVVEPAWAAAEPVTDAPRPAPRDWLKNLVGPGDRNDPGAPSP